MNKTQQEIFNEIGRWSTISSMKRRGLLNEDGSIKIISNSGIEEEVTVKEITLEQFIPPENELDHKAKYCLVYKLNGEWRRSTYADFKNILRLYYKHVEIGLDVAVMDLEDSLRRGLPDSIEYVEFNKKNKFKRKDICLSKALGRKVYNKLSQKISRLKKENGKLKEMIEGAKTLNILNNK